MYSGFVLSNSSGRALRCTQEYPMTGLPVIEVQCQDACHRIIFRSRKPNLPYPLTHAVVALLMCTRVNSLTWEVGSPRLPNLSSWSSTAPFTLHGTVILSTILWWLFIGHGNFVYLRGHFLFSRGHLILSYKAYKFQ